MSNFIADAITLPRRLPDMAPDAQLLAKLCRWQKLSDRNAALCDRQDELWATAHDVVPVPAAIRMVADNPMAPLDRGTLLARRDYLAGIVAGLTAGKDPGATDAAVNIFTREIEEIRGKLVVLDDYEARIGAERERSGHAAAYAEYVQSGDEMTALEKEIAAMPAAGFVGILAKLCLANQFMGFIVDEGAKENQDLRLIGGAVRDLERLSGVPLARLLDQ